MEIILSLYRASEVHTTFLPFAHGGLHHFNECLRHIPRFLYENLIKGRAPSAGAYQNYADINIMDHAV